MEKLKLTIADVVVLIGIAGFATTIVAGGLSFLISKETNHVLEYVALSGVICFLLPAFLTQFALPAGLMPHFYPKFKRSLSFKILAYLIFFPSFTLATLGAFDTLFHFWPNSHQAAFPDENLLIVWLLRGKWSAQTLIAAIFIYGTMVGSGLIYRVFVLKKLQAKLA